METSLTIGLEVEPIVIVVILTVLVVMNGNLLPTSLHGTIFPTTEVVFNVGTRPLVLTVSHGTGFGYPAVQHNAILIECVSLAVDGLLAYAGAVALVSFTIGLHIVVVILSGIIVIILILVYYLNPGIGNHNTVSIYIVGVIVIFNQFVNCHGAAFFTVQPVPVVTRFFPLVFYSVAIFVVEIPLSIFLNPASSCERSHGSADSKQGCCRCNCNYFCLLSHNECTLLFLF